MDSSSPLEQKQALVKEVARHARPHIETHVRSKGHSAVAGAAYRLGLKLLDERTGACHDFHRRSIRGEIILALTLAPSGSPDWATQPQALWNRVEDSEKRKDAQLARDYRIPVPLGLDSDQASVLAEQMARFIADTLKTPVSVGVHRDSEVDVLGEKKASERVGYHAHLYFPTRKLACFEETGKEQVEAPTGGEATGFGSKLTILSNKNTSAAFVEMLNTKWAELANQLAGASGLRAGYDHRSYTRQGVGLTPQPTVGQAATALERKGMETRRGNQLREAVKAAQQVLETTTPEVPTMVATPPSISAEVDLVEAMLPAPAPKPEPSLPSERGMPVPAVSDPPIELIEPDFSTFGVGGNVVFLDKLRKRRQQQDASEERSSGSGERPTQVEPPRDSRRLFGLSHAALGSAACCR